MDKNCSGNHDSEHFTAENLCRNIKKSIMGQPIFLSGSGFRGFHIPPPVGGSIPNDRVFLITGRRKAGAFRMRFDRVIKKFLRNAPASLPDPYIATLSSRTK